jgi:hypothetical protein
MSTTRTAFGADNLLGEEGHLNIICVARHVDQALVPTGGVKAVHDQAESSMKPRKTRATMTAMPIAKTSAIKSRGILSGDVIEGCSITEKPRQ